MTLRIGFLGCGLIARAHARGLAGVADAEIVSVHDPDDARSAEFAAAHGAATARSAEAVIEASDAVYVTTWTSEHPDLVAAVVGSGRAVFCEKPLAVDLASAEAMVADVERSGVINQVGLVLRRSPAFRWLRHQVVSGTHGPAMSMIFRDDQYLPVQGMYGSTWRGDPARAGSGTLLEHSIHDLDLIEWILGPIDRVSCLTGHVHAIEGIEDQASVMLHAASGAHALLSSTWHDILSRPSLRRVEVFCRDAFFDLDGDWNGPVSRESSRDDTERWQGDALHALVNRLDGAGSNPDADFVKAVLDGQPAVPDFRTALRAHVLADAAYRSAVSNGLPIEV